MPPKGPRRLGFGNPRGGGASTLLGGQVSPLAPPSRWDLGGPAPSSLHPINGGGWEGCSTLAFGAAPPSSNSSSYSVVLGEALQEYHELHHHHVIVLLEFSLNFSSPLDGSIRRRRPWAVRVLNAEAPLFGA